MPIFITQGRYTKDAIRGMTSKPEDRAEAVGKLFKQVGGKLIGYYITFGEYDFLVIGEAADEHKMAQVLFATGSSGAVTDLKTTLAIPSAEAKKDFAGAADALKSYRAPGG